MGLELQFILAFSQRIDFSFLLFKNICIVLDFDSIENVTCSYKCLFLVMFSNV